MQTTETTLRERVQRGVALLDEHYPHWWEQISADSLHMGYCCHCVLGQLYGEFPTGKRELLLDHASSIEHGFFVAMASNVESANDLRPFWLEAIEERKTP